MKYRDHSLRYVPRDTKRPAPRSLDQQPVVQEKELDTPFVHRHSNDTEPLFDVNDKESRLQKIKDGFGTAAHAGAHITSTHIVPKAKHHAKKVSSRVKSNAPGLANQLKRVGVPQLKTYQKVIVVLAIFFAGYYIATHIGPAQTGSNVSQDGTTQTGPVGGTSPAYTTLVPSGSSIEKLGGWKRVSPPNSNPVFAYVDTIDRIQITVSEQPLPRDFSNDPDKDVKELASGFNANDRHVADDATIYFLGTSSKGPQSVILAKKKTLILIKAPTQIKVESWSRYIASLE